MKIKDFSPKATVMSVSFLQLNGIPGCRALLQLRPVFVSVVPVITKGHENVFGGKCFLPRPCPCP